MHEPRPIPRGENETKSFDDDLIARTLSNAADIRRTLRFSRDDLFLDADGRRSDPEQAAQASTDGCIRLASMALCPDDSLDARTSAGTPQHVSKDASVTVSRPTTTTPTQPSKRLLPTSIKPPRRSGTQPPVTPIDGTLPACAWVSPGLAAPWAGFADEDAPPVGRPTDDQPAAVRAVAEGVGLLATAL